MEPVVLDACALIAYFKGGSGCEFVENHILNPGFECFVHAINLCEVYYDFLKCAAQQEVEDMLRSVSELKIVIRDDLDPNFWKQVGQYKSSLRRISLADCFALALAQRLNATLMTADHHEFDSVSTMGIVKFAFIR